MGRQKLFSQLLFILSVFGLFQITFSSSSNDPYYRILSRGKPVSQSSTEGSYVASLATDGNYEDVESQCAKTTTSDNPYLEVDLEKEIYVYVICFVLPKSEAKYSNMKVTISKADGTSFPTSIDNEDVRDKFYIAPRKYIRHIKISRVATSTQLTVCEIAAYNMPIENIAGRQATDGSKEIIYGAPYRAVDLDFDSSFTSRVHQNPWFQVDLKEIYLVHEVFLAAMFSFKSTMEPLLDFNLRVGNSLERNGNANPLCTIASLLIEEARSFYCDMFGRYINIHRPNQQGALYIAEIFVNTDNAESIKATAANEFSNTAAAAGKGANKVMDLDLKKWFVTKNKQQQKRLHIDLKEEYNIVMVYIVAKKLGPFHLKMGLTDVFDSQSDCVPGLHEMPGSHDTQYFFCVQRIPTKYIQIRQYDEDKLMQIAEIALYGETKPVINYTASGKYVWAEEHKVTTLSCDINGYPTPAFSWIKNKTLVASGSSSLTLRNVKQTDSGTYECWGNNTHGYNAKQVELRVTSNLRICADHGEIKYDLRTLSIIEHFEIRGDHWYSSFDAKQMKHLQFQEQAPKSSSCQLWLKTKHPKLQDGVIQGTLCLRNTTHDCVATIDVDIRRCAAYYIYHFKSLRSTSKYQICFEPAKISLTGLQPAISAPVADHALSHKTFQTEIEVLESYHCLVMCQLDNRCKSFNFSKKNKICELNTSTKKESPKNYGSRNEYSYYQMSSGAIKVVRRGEL